MRDGTWLVDGQYSFYDFLEYFDMEDLYAEHDYNTLSGLILEILERVPKTGEKLKWLDFEFEIVDMDGARIDKGFGQVLEKWVKCLFRRVRRVRYSSRSFACQY